MRLLNLFANGEYKQGSLRLLIFFANERGVRCASVSSTRRTCEGLLPLLQLRHDGAAVVGGGEGSFGGGSSGTAAAVRLGSSGSSGNSGKAAAASDGRGEEWFSRSSPKVS